MPKTWLDNLTYRQRLLRNARHDEELQRDLWEMCRRDLLFYINAFMWIPEPRDDTMAAGRETKKLPFITYQEYQDEELLVINENLGVRDVCTVKSRDVGASIKLLAIFDWRWRFYEDESFLMVSRKEELVWKKGDPKALFSKLEFFENHLPHWLRPEQDFVKLHKLNKETGSVIDGESANQDLATGDRRKCVFLDEFSKIENAHAVLASTRDVTSSRIFNFTPKGAAHASYEIAHNEKIVQRRIHWSSHPVKAKGLYYHDQAGKKVLVECKDAKKLRDQGFKLRSPWFDEQCDRAVHPWEIAQELELDFLGSDVQFFDAAVIKAIADRDCRPAMMRGELDFSLEDFSPAGFQEAEGGHLYLWFRPDEEPPRDRSYAIGCDISAGTGATPSTASVVDIQTGEKVAGFANANMSPEEYAKFIRALCLWFRGKDSEAYLIFEAAGPGMQFGKKIWEIGHRRLYMRRNEVSIDRKVQKNIPGWWPTAENKRLVLGEYKEALGTSFMNRDVDAVRECLMFIYVPARNTVEHSRAGKTIDASGAGSNHADRVIADALAWHAAKLLGGGKLIAADRPKDIPKSSLAYRWQEYEREEQQDRFGFLESAGSW